MKKISKKKKMPKKPLALLAKVKKQLEAFKVPSQEEIEKSHRRNLWPSAEPTVDEYKKLDPFWLSTMSGQFTGRVLQPKKRRLPWFLRKLGF